MHELDWENETSIGKMKHQLGKRNINWENETSIGKMKHLIQRYVP